MQKNKKAIIFILIMALIFIFIFQNITLGVINNVNAFKPNTTTPIDDTAKTIIGELVGIVTSVGSVAAMGFLIIIGIRFMLGSVEEKAQYKESLKPYLVGAFLVFGILRVVDILYDLGTGLVS